MSAAGTHLYRKFSHLHGLSPHVSLVKARKGERFEKVGENVF